MINSLCISIDPACRDIKVRRCVLGLGYTAVELEDGRTGLAATLPGNATRSCTAFGRAGSLAGASAGDLLDLGAEDDSLSRSVALACLNAFNVPGEESDVLAALAPREGERVVMVGYITPVARELVRQGLEVSVFEHRPLADPLVRPQEELPERMAAADLVILSATTIINGTLPELLALPGNARERLLMGPSTPLVPESFAHTPLTCLAGMHVHDPRRAMTIVMEGGGTQVLVKQGAVRKTWTPLSRHKTV